MEQLYIGFWIPAYFVIGVLAHLLDARVGVPARRRVINLVSREPGEIHQGFIVARSRRTMFVWSLVISYALSAIVIATTDVVWYLEAAFAVPEAVACFIGMHAVPSLRWARAALARGLDGIESAAGPSCRSVVEQAIDHGKRATRALRESRGAAERASETVRHSRIDAMDALLGRQERRDV